EVCGEGEIHQIVQLGVIEAAPPANSDIGCVQTRLGGICESGGGRSFRRMIVRADGATRQKNTKTQTPNSKETPNFKFQMSQPQFENSIHVRYFASPSARAAEAPAFGAVRLRSTNQRMTE